MTNVVQVASILERMFYCLGKSAKEVKQIVNKPAYQLPRKMVIEDRLEKIEKIVEEKIHDQ